MRWSAPASTERRCCATARRPRPGLDTPLLHYNVGVVRYELGDFAESAAEFAHAAAEPALAALASYNRGLALRAAGDSAAATAAFAAAADAADDRDLRRLAADAAESRPALGPSRRTPRAASRVRRPSSDTRIGELELTAAARLGQDDNVYRTPADPYVDLADPGSRWSQPVVQAASFMPAELHAAYVLGNEAGDTEFLFRYDMDGAFYDAEFSNATEVDQRFSMGANIVLGERERRRRTVETEFFVSGHHETNFDPDNGLERGDRTASRSRTFQSGSRISAREFAASSSRRLGTRHLGLRARVRAQRVQAHAGRRKFRSRLSSPRASTSTSTSATS